MILAAVAVPDAFATILADLGGALAGIMAPLSHPGSKEREPDTTRQ